MRQCPEGRVVVGYRGVIQKPQTREVLARKSKTEIDAKREAWRTAKSWYTEPVVREMIALGLLSIYAIPETIPDPAQLAMPF